MEIINYVSLAAAAVTFFLLLVAPRWGMPGLVLMFPLLDYAIPRAGPGLNAETVLYVAAALSLGLRARLGGPAVRVVAQDEVVPRRGQRGHVGRGHRRVVAAALRLGLSIPDGRRPTTCLDNQSAVARPRPSP